VPRLATIAIALAIAATGCGGPKRYVNRNADLGAVRTVAILPFENLTTDKLCAERLNRIFLTEILNYRAFQVVEPGQVMRAVRRDQFDLGSLTADDIKRLGKALNVQALVLGSVLEFEEKRASTGAQVKVQFRLVDTESAVTVWSVTRTRAGLGFAARMFGFEGDSATEIAQQLIRDEVARLAR
jgi:TolB-like protein